MLKFAVKIAQEIKYHNFYCPVYSCFQRAKSIDELRKHINLRHSCITQAGVTLNDNGGIEYDSKLLKYMMVLFKIFPEFMANDVLCKGKKLLKNIMTFNNFKKR